MKTTEFCYWLQGYFEMRMVGLPSEQILTNDQAMLIQSHLALVFKHDIDPSQGSQEHQAELQAIHDKPKIGGVGPNGEVYRC